MKSFNYFRKNLFNLYIYCYMLFSFQRTNWEIQSLKTKQEINWRVNERQDVQNFYLLRKEVIHPHVLVGMPCYDLTPIIGPTLDSSLDCSLGHRLRVLPTLMVWRAVCTNPENVFTAACWSAITSDSNFMESGCRLQSELRHILKVLLHVAVLHLVICAIVVRV